MKKTSFAQWAAITMVFLAAASCQQEPLSIQPPISPCISGPCNPGGGTIGPTLCVGPDLVVNSVIAYGVSGNVMPYGVAIKNIGNAAATITTSNVFWQAWLSTNGVTRNVAACGQSFVPTTLAVNQIIWNRINCTFPASVNLNNYHYLIVDLSVAGSVGECNSSNNTFVRTPLPL